MNAATVTAPLDTVASTAIAHNVAHFAQLPESTALHNQTDTVKLVEASSINNGTSVTPKPAIVTTDIKTKADIRTYIAVAGDNVTSVAQKFSVTSDSIRWSNDLTNSNIPIGKLLYISPIADGIVYAVQTGDTPDNLAQKFHANKEKIIAFNDAEVNGLTVGDHIIIPGGSIISTPTAALSLSLGGGFAWGGNAPIYNPGGSGYDFGTCTYWVALRRSQVGKPIPSNLGNAITWFQLAQKAGLSTGTTPQKYAVVWSPLALSATSYGHVGFVEDVLPDGTVKISDMNWSGWNVVSQRTLTPQQAQNYGYIY
ncbi:MAG: CHAP domain-containing protein [Candidatus Saccharimonadales bacterium]